MGTELSQAVFGARETKAITVGNAVKALADIAFANTTGIRRLTITAGAVAIRVTWSGTNPTTTLGHYVAANETLVVDGNSNCNNLKMFSTAGDSACSVTNEG